ncbi:hypothetical protein SAMN04490193_0696 [Pseudomonas marginalis]|nr:hypothetical protein SAMN04490193_0696 [Pseudomonas marginalis]
MSMLIPGQNQLAEPAIIAVDEFEPLLAEFKAFVVDYVATRAPQSAARLKVSLDNESGLLTQAAAQQLLQTYADSCPCLDGRVNPSWIDYAFHSAGARNCRYSST